MSMRYPGGFIASTPVTAAYPSGVWTQAQAIPYQAQNVWTRDQYWPYTTLLLQGNGTNGAQNNTFLDSSSNNFTITRNGNTTQGSFTPYEPTGYWSNYFDGSTAWLTASASSSLALSGNFTVEFWFYYTGTATNLTPGILTDSGTGAISTFELNNGSTYLQIAGISATNTVNRTTLTGGAIGPNQWYHLAFVRNSNVITAYINGVAVSTTMTNSVTTGQLVQVGNGRSASPSVSFLGYLSNYRIVSSAVYTSNFTPTAAPLTAITGTQLLTCQDNRFRDNSSNALTFTVNGSPSVQAFQPFPGATTYSGTVLGGSAYYDGSGDYLSVPSNAAWAFGTGDFTVECWVNPSTQGGHGSANNDCIIDFRPSSNGAYGTLYIFNNGTGVYWFVNSSNRITGGAIPNNAWTHLVVSRVSGNTRLFINGVQSGSTYADSTNYLQGTPWIGQFNDGVGSGWFNGYITDMRIVKGSGVTSVTVPTAPLTAITNTQLLLSTTNAGISDAATMNDLETVGNAQVSTSVVKYGTGSMAFDGNGDGLFRPNTDLLNFGSGSFTIEFWINFSSKTGYQTIASMGYSPLGSGGNWIIQTGNGDGKLIFYRNNGVSSTAIATDAGPTVNNGQWYHIAIVKNGTTTTIYRDGVNVGSGSDSNSYSSTGVFYVGGGSDTGFNNYYFNGYLDDLRITKGAARYITNFTPPPARMPGQ